MKIISITQNKKKQKYIINYKYFRIKVDNTENIINIKFL